MNTAEQSENTARRRAAFRQRCADAGLRVTHQRLAVFEELAACKDHPDADTLHARIVDRHPTLSLNTVYRTLGVLVKHGLVLRNASVGNSARFDANTLDHDHFFCTECDSLVDLPHALVGSGQITDEARMVGSVNHVLTVFVGCCTKCAEREASDDQAAGI